MRPFFLCLFVFFVTPVLLHPNGEKIEKSLKDSLTNVTFVNHQKEETKVLVPDQQIESTEVSIEETTSTVERKQSRKKKRPNNKRRQNRINQLRQKGKRPNGRKRRPQNDKKGYGKKTKRPVFKAIRYLNRSSNTDQLNKALDEMLECMSLKLAGENSTFSLRLSNFREDMKISPWAFVALNKTELSKKEGKIRRGRAAIDFEKETIEGDAAESDEDDDDDAPNVEGEAEIEIVTESIAEESSSPSEKVENTMTEEEDDNDDDVETVTQISHDFKKPFKSNATHFYQTQKPTPVVLDDGTIEYNLQLLSENDIKQRKLGFTFEDFSSGNFQDDDVRPAKKLDGKRERGSSRRNNSRRPSATVKGIDQILRKGDVLIGLRGNSTAHIIDATLVIGPLQFLMDEKAGFLLQQSRVSMAPLSARLRMTEVGGKLVGVRLKPTKIRPDEALVTFRLSEDGRVPTLLQTARLVTYLSQEMTKVWNSGYLLRRLKRQFRQLFIDDTADSKRAHTKSQDARKLVETLALSAFGAAIKGDTI